MTRLMARDMCHPRQRWRVNVGELALTEIRHGVTRKNSDMRNRIRARQAGDAKCARVAPRRIFLVRLKRGNEKRFFSSREREKEEGERKRLRERAADTYYSRRSRLVYERRDQMGRSSSAGFFSEMPAEKTAESDSD